MLFDDSYQTIESQADCVFSDRGSKFLSFAYPVISESELKLIIARLKSGYPKANHYCYAMRFTADRSVFRNNDDGEPAGTAGRPILNVLLSRDVTNIAVVVIRYFGGTLLGVPGLINAYKTATENVLSKATIVRKTIDDFYTIYFFYRQMNEVKRIIKAYNLLVVNQNFDAECSVQLGIRKTLVNAVLEKLNNFGGIKIKYEHSI